MKRRLILAGVLLALVAASADAYLIYVDRMTPRVPLTAHDLARKPTPMKQIYLVTVGDRPEPFDVELVEYYERAFGLRVERLPDLPVDPSLVNPQRRQLRGDATIARIAERHPDLAGDPRVAIIGLTAQDLYGERLPWRFAFAVRDERERFAVISTARMDPANYGAADPELWRARLRKMVSKNIGLLYYRFPLSLDHRSVMYGRILGIEELDEVGEHFLTTDDGRLTAPARPSPPPRAEARSRPSSYPAGAAHRRPSRPRKSPARAGRDEDTIPGGEHARWSCEPRSKASL